MTKLRQITGIAIAAILSISALSGCTTATTSENSDASRVRFYSSLSQLTSDSSAVVYGTVTSQRTATDIDPVTAFTISTVTVSSAPKGSELIAGSTVEVRQFGDEKQTGPAPLLTKGSDYLLYLTLSGLDGPLATQYYITGGTAGIYESDSKEAVRSNTGDTTFSQVVADEGDDLPQSVNLSQAKG